MKAFRNMLKSKTAGFTLVEIMIVVLIIGILLAIAVPNFLQARESSRAKACIGNLKQIDTAKQQWMMDNKASTFSTYEITPTATTASNGTETLQTYLRTVPKCPESGYYETGNESQLPICVVGTGGTTVTGSVAIGTGIATPHQLT